MPSHHVIGVVPVGQQTVELLIVLSLPLQLLLHLGHKVILLVHLLLGGGRPLLCPRLAPALVELGHRRPLGQVGGLPRRDLVFVAHAEGDGATEGLDVAARLLRLLHQLLHLLAVIGNLQKAFCWSRFHVYATSQILPCTI